LVEFLLRLPLQVRRPRRSARILVPLHPLPLFLRSVLVRRLHLSAERVLPLPPLLPLLLALRLLLLFNGMTLPWTPPSVASWMQMPCFSAASRPTNDRELRGQCTG